jgi:hypothetical protein
MFVTSGGFQDSRYREPWQYMPNNMSMDTMFVTSSGFHVNRHTVSIVFTILTKNNGNKVINYSKSMLWIKTFMFFKEIVKILAKFIKRIFLQSKMWLKHGYFNFALESREGDFSQYWVIKHLCVVISIPSIVVTMATITLVIYWYNIWLQFEDKFCIFGLNSSSWIVFSLYVNVVILKTDPLPLL